MAETDTTTIDRTADTAAVTTPAQTGRAVVVCTDKRGVFFGYAENTEGDVIHLKGARCAIHWSKKTGGVLGLGGIGPQEGSRVGERADVELRGITAVISCTPEAVAVWEAAKWA